MVVSQGEAMSAVAWLQAVPGCDITCSHHVTQIDVTWVFSQALVEVQQPVDIT